MFSSDNTSRIKERQTMYMIGHEAAKHLCISREVLVAVCTFTSQEMCMFESIITRIKN